MTGMVCRLARQTKDADQGRRLLSLASIYDGGLRADAARLGSVTVQIVRDLVVRFFVLADIAANAKHGRNAAPISPMALEAIKRIDGLFDIEREIDGLAADRSLERRRKDSQPLIEELHGLLQTERAKLSRSSPVAEAITCSSVGMASRHSSRMAGFA